MVNESSDRRPRRLFVFTYPGHPTATVNVVVENLKKAQNGRANAQRSLLFQYKKAAKIDKNLQLHWKRLELEPHTAREARERKGL
jgi:hypothetical protein